MPNDTAAPGLLEAVWRYRWSSILIVLLVLLLSTAAGIVLNPGAVASATVGLTTPSSINVLAQGVQGDASSARYASQRALFATSDEVLTAAAAALPDTTVADLQASVEVSPSTTATSILVQATEPTPSQAVRTVDAVVAAYRSNTKAQVASLTKTALAAIDRNIRAVRNSLQENPSNAEQTAGAATLSGLTRQAADLQTDSAVFGDGVQFVQAASLDSVVSQRLPYKYMAVGLLLGLVVAAVVAWLRADNNRRVSTAEQVEPLLGVPLLGELTDLGSKAQSPSGRLDLANMMRDFGVSLLSDRKPGVIVVVGVQQRSGTSTVALALATAAAAEGMSVLLIDADPSGRTLSQMLELSSLPPDIFHATDSDTMTDEAIQDVEVGFGLKISAISAGRGDPDRSALTAATVHSFLDRVRRRYDAVVIDAQTPGHDYVASNLVAAADSTVIVVPAKARLQSLVDLRRHVSLSKARVSGAVFTHARSGRRHAQSH